MSFAAYYLNLGRHLRSVRPSLPWSYPRFGPLGLQLPGRSPIGRRRFVALFVALTLTACDATTDQSAVSADSAEGSTEPSTAIPPATLGQTTEPARATAQGLDKQDSSTLGELTVLILGDSISAAYGIQRESGWVAKLQQRLASFGAGYRVINASVSGETTQGGRARIEQALTEHKPDLVYFELGGNDALRGYPVASMQDNLIAMLSRVHDSGARAILLGMDIPPNYGPRYRSSFRATFAAAASATESCYVPFFLAGIPLEPGMMQDDGIHPTAAAQDTLLTTGWQALQQCLADTHPALLSIP